MIELVNVSKIFNKGKSNQVDALKSVSIKVENGELVSIVGPSGSGKSTLLNIIALLTPLDEGRYYFDSVDVSDLNDSHKATIRNQDIGIVLQDYGLIEDLDAVSNVEIPLVISGVARKSARKKAIDSIKQVGLEKKIHTKVGLLSGGERQRVAIARAIVTDAKLILADEPTGAVDSHTGEEIMKLFISLNKLGKTIIIVTHNQSVSDMCGRKLQIVDGIVSELF